MLQSPSAVSMPWRAPTNTVFWGSRREDGKRTWLESEITHGITWGCNVTI